MTNGIFLKDMGSLEFVGGFQFNREKGLFEVV